jgi:hypothetical protein
MKIHPIPQCETAVFSDKKHHWLLTFLLANQPNYVRLNPVSALLRAGNPTRFFPV